MTRSIYEPTPSRAQAQLGYTTEQLLRRPNNGLAFASLTSNSYSWDGTGTPLFVDFSTATLYTNAPDTFPEIGVSGGNYGITSVPSGLYEVVSWIVNTSAPSANGNHQVLPWSSSSTSSWGPYSENQKPSITTAFSTDTCIYHFNRRGHQGNLILGVKHFASAFSNGPKNFTAGITMTLLGGYPTAV